MYQVKKRTEILKSKIMLNHFLMGALGAGHGVLQFNELNIYESSQLYVVDGVATKVSDENALAILGLRGVGLIFSAVLIFTIIKHYQFDLEKKKQERFGYGYSSIWNPENKVKIVLEIFICSLFMPPFLDFIVTFKHNGGIVSYSADMIITCFVFLKGYTVTRCYEHIAIWTNYSSKKIANLLGIRTDARFAFKSDVNNYNFWGLMIVSLFALFYLAAYVFAFEKYDML